MILRQPFLPVGTGTGFPDDPGKNTTFLPGHKFPEAEIQRTHGGKRTGYQYIGLEGLIVDGINFHLVKQDTHDVVSGILVGKPARRSKYEPYKEVYRRVVGREAGRPDLPILCNVNFGHADPIGVLPIGVRARLDADAKTLTLLESATA